MTHVRLGGIGDDEAIAGLAGRQEGIVARRQLLELGVSARSIDHRLGVGRLRPLFRGIYAVGHEAISAVGWATAATMSYSPGASATHWTALILWDLIEPTGNAVHVTATQPRVRRRGTVLHRASLPPDELTVRHGVPVTTLPRTFLDMSRVTSQARLFRLIKDAEFRKEIRVPELAAILERYPRRRGRRNLAAIVDPLTAASRPTRSPLEDRFVGFCARRGLPLPETNVDLTVGGRRYQADCLWRDARVIVELDGRDAHARELAFEDDRARDRALATAGWVPVRVTTAQLDFDGDRLENELRALRCTWRLGESRGIDHT